MPKKTTRDKRGRAPVRTRAGHKSRSAPAAHSVKDLLSRFAPALTRVTEKAEKQDFWGSWLASRLPPELNARISGVTEREGTVVVFAESAAWSARLKFALLELEPAARAAAAGFAGLEVRVLPRSRKPASGD
jgi:hypothetical protein